MNKAPVDSDWYYVVCSSAAASLDYNRTNVTLLSTGS